MRYLESVTQLAVGIWVGAMTGFAYAAPLIFEAFGPDRQGAGNLAGKTIWRLNSLGIVLGAVALAALLPRLRQKINRWRAALLLGALAMGAVGALYIFPRMAEAQPSRPLQEYAETDPIRVNYNRWHERSRQVFGAAILLGAGVVVMGPLQKEKI